MFYDMSSVVSVKQPNKNTTKPLKHMPKKTR
jgi:hypothetical protein